MFGLGVGELSIILLILVLLFGASRLPGIGRGLGLGIGSFKLAVWGFGRDERAVPGVQDTDLTVEQDGLRACLDSQPYLGLGQQGMEFIKL